MTKPRSTKRATPDTAKRGEGGRFLPGTPRGPGNPYIKRVAAYRAALNEAVTPGDIKKAIRALVTAAQSGDVVAIKELLDRTVGKAVQPVEAAEGLTMPVKVIVVRDEPEAKS